MLCFVVHFIPVLPWNIMPLASVITHNPILFIMPWWNFWHLFFVFFEKLVTFPPQMLWFPHMPLLWSIYSPLFHSTGIGLRPFVSYCHKTMDLLWFLFITGRPSTIPLWVYISISFVITGSSDLNGVLWCDVVSNLCQDITFFQLH